MIKQHTQTIRREREREREREQSMDIFAKLTDKIFSWYKKLSLSYIHKLFLNFSKFEPQDSNKLYSYKKKSVYHFIVIGLSISVTLTKCKS